MPCPLIVVLRIDRMRSLSSYHRGRKALGIFPMKVLFIRPIVASCGVDTRSLIYKEW